MSYGEELFAPREDMTSRSSFELALRGYDKRQVDQYVSQMGSEMSALAADRERALGQVHDLAAQLEQAQAELSELRQRPPQVERASFRDLGPTVDEILALAEKQAREITEAAAQRAADQQAEVGAVLADARQRADQLRADSEAAYERAEQEAKRINEQSAQQIADARTEAEALVDAARSQARQDIEAARAQTHQEIQARHQALSQLQDELDTAQQQLSQARQEGATAGREVAELQARLDEVGRELAAELDRLDEARRSADSAERRAKEVRARVQREAERVAQLAAAAVMAAAARGAEPTGEYPVVVPAQAPANGLPDEATEPPRHGNGLAQEATEPPAGGVAPEQVTPGHVLPTDAGGYVRHDADNAIPTQRVPQLGGIVADAGERD